MACAAQTNQTGSKGTNRWRLIIPNPHTNHITLEQMQKAVGTNIFSEWDMHNLRDFVRSPADSKQLWLSVIEAYTLQIEDLKAVVNIINESGAKCDAVKEVTVAKVGAFMVGKVVTGRWLFQGVFDEATIYFWKPPQQEWQELGTCRFRY